jgi:hypothetical protein
VNALIGALPSSSLSSLHLVEAFERQSKSENLTKNMVALFQAFKEMRNLTDLNLSKNYFSDESELALTLSLGSYSRLATFTANSCRLQLLSNFAEAFKQLSSLTSISLKLNLFDTKGYQDLAAALPSMRQLKTLIIRNENRDNSIDKKMNSAYDSVWHKMTKLTYLSFGPCFNVDWLSSFPYSLIRCHLHNPADYGWTNEMESKVDTFVKKTRAREGIRSSISLYNTVCRVHRATADLPSDMYLAEDFSDDENRYANVEEELD